MPRPGPVTALSLLVTALVLTSPAARALDWTPYTEESTVEIVTRDEDGGVRETSVWMVVVEDHGYVRTNDSRWLANIRRGSPVAVRVRGSELPMSAREVDDAAVQARVEEAFLSKYGLMQRLMSALRFRVPTVLELTPVAERTSLPQEVVRAGR
jgi:hypothetical protein